ncbi:MAG TPA: imidazolonepropionase [Methylomirabilota bacterium]|jgi:imidazolonepropionase|nr:imidazolonepropionase [Methylomirabilota bacterium]
MPAGSFLITGRGRLLLPQPYDGPLPWAIHAQDGRVTWVGARADAPATDAVSDMAEALVTPGLVNAHTHPAFLGDRSDEAAARLAGASYTGGGILRTVAATRAASDDALAAAIEGRLRAELAAGTTTIECKSGYGLSTSEELRALRLIGEGAERVGITVIRTFLGAHAVPPEAGSMEQYAALVADEMLPAVVAAGAAQFCDAFCDRGFFSQEATERILGAASGMGLGIRMHADQLTRSGGAELAARLGATSADHLEQLDDAGVAALARSGTVATLLPGPAIVMRGGLPPARALLDAGVTVALASDANAGTFGAWGAMPLVIGLGATVLEMTIQEALTAATAGGAAALRLTGRKGVLAVGADADIVAWDAEHEGAFALHLGEIRPAQVFIGGERSST